MPKYSLENIQSSYNWQNPRNYVELIPNAPLSYKFLKKESDNNYKKAKKENRHLYNDYLFRKDEQENQDWQEKRKLRNYNRFDTPKSENIRILSNPNAKFHTGYINQNVLDSLSYHWGQNPNVPAEVVYGLADRENGFGTFYNNGYYNTDAHSILNNHSYIDSEIDNVMAKSRADAIDELTKKGVKPSFTSAFSYEPNPEFNRLEDSLTVENYAKYRPSLMKKIKSDPINGTDVDPYSWSWEYFRRGNYNPSAPYDYEQLVRKNGSDFINSKEFKEYWQNRGKAQYEKGKREIPKNHKQAYKDLSKRNGGRISLENLISPYSKNHSTYEDYVLRQNNKHKDNVNYVRKNYDRVSKDLHYTEGTPVDGTNRPGYGTILQHLYYDPISGDYKLIEDYSSNSVFNKNKRKRSIQ